MFKVAISIFSNISQSVCSTLDWVLNSQSDLTKEYYVKKTPWFDWVLHTCCCEFPIQKKIIQILTCPYLAYPKRFDSWIFFEPMHGYILWQRWDKFRFTDRRLTSIGNRLSFINGKITFMQTIKTFMSGSKLQFTAIEPVCSKLRVTSYRCWGQQTCESSNVAVHTVQHGIESAWVSTGDGALL